MKKKWIILLLILILTSYLALDFVGVISNINNQFSRTSFDTSCNSDSECKMISYRCPSAGCGRCDDVICAKGSWENRFCPLPSISGLFQPQCATCLKPNFECKCVNNICEKV
jgi:hypothetical protein